MLRRSKRGDGARSRKIFSPRGGDHDDGQKQPDGCRHDRQRSTRWQAAARSGSGHTAAMTPEAAAKGVTWSPMTAPFAGLAEAPMQWLSQAAEMMSPTAKAGETAAPVADRAGSAWMREALDYWVDAAQRQILFWDVMRKRGNQTLEHYRKGKPPVLVFDYDLIVDGRQLERPVNYMLLRIKPERGVATDPKKRPFVIVDPRAGHGPGIGGMKELSQVGVALRNGHPVYFVAFHPEPEPGQTIADVAWAEAPVPAQGPGAAIPRPRASRSWSATARPAGRS